MNAHPPLPVQERMSGAVSRAIHDFVLESGIRRVLDSRITRLAPLSLLQSNVRAERCVTVVTLSHSQQIAVLEIPKLYLF